MTHLRAGINGIENTASVSVGESDAAVCRAPAAGQQVALEGAPGQPLDGGLVGGDPVQHGPPPVPDEQQVVVGSAGQLLSIGGPLEAADFLLMAPQYAHDVLPLPAHGQGLIVGTSQKFDAGCDWCAA